MLLQFFSSQENFPRIQLPSFARGKVFPNGIKVVQRAALASFIMIVIVGL